MKKIILALFLGMTFSITASAQTLQFTIGDTLWVNDAISNTDIYQLSYVKYTGVDPITVVWERQNENVPSGWATAICDKNLCWGSGISTKEFTMVANEKADLYGHFYTDGNRGTASFTLIVYEKENETNGDTLVIMGRAFGVGVDKVTAADIKVYPNPARTNMTISLPESISGGTIEIYDMLGNKVIVDNVNGNETEVNVANLPVGKYVLRFIDQNGTAYNKRFQKIN